MKLGVADSSLKGEETGALRRLRRRSALAWGMGALAAPWTAAASSQVVADGDDWPSPGASTSAVTERLQPVLDAAASVAPLRSLLVAHQGHLVAERYFAGMGPSVLQPIHSVTKSVTSMLVGQALAQGRIRTLSQTLAELLPEGAARFPQSAAAQSTLRQVLTGQTLIEYDLGVHAADLYQAADPVGWVFERPSLGVLPAEGWVYNDAAVSLLGPVLERAYQAPLEEIATAQLFKPLGIRQVDASRNRAGKAMTHAGLRLRARDHLKLAWLAASGGRWGHAAVVPQEWMTQSTGRQGPASWRIEHVTDVGYGHLWFTGRLHGHAVAWGWGYGAQFALAVPALELAVATNAMAPRPAQLPEQNRAVMGVVAEVVKAVEKA